MSKLTARWPEKLPPKIAKRKTHEQTANDVRKKTTKQTVQNASEPQQNDRSATDSLCKGKNAFSGCDAQSGLKSLIECSGIDTTATKRPKGFVLDVFNALLSQEAEAAYQEAMSVCDASGDREAMSVCGEDGAEPNANTADAVPCRGGNVQDADPVNHPSHYTQGDHDVVNHPSHYTQGGIECIDAIQAAVTGLSGMEAVCTGNVIKYVWRHAHKNGTEDLRKARFYLNKLILLSERREKNESRGASERKERKGRC